jgi:hypothetical protein
MGVPGKIVYRLSPEQILMLNAEFLSAVVREQAGSGVVWSETS